MAHRAQFVAVIFCSYPVVHWTKGICEKGYIPINLIVKPTQSINLPGHSWGLQSWDSNNDSVHGLPPCSAGVLVLLRCWVPIPQVSLQFVHCPQLCKTQSTEIRVEMAEILRLFMREVLMKIKFDLHKDCGCNAYVLPFPWPPLRKGSPRSLYHQVSSCVSESPFHMF